MRSAHRRQQRDVRSRRRAISTAACARVRWFGEALGHLDVIRPIIARKFRLDDLLASSVPIRPGLRVVSSQRPLAAETLEQVEVFYRRTRPHPFVLRVHPGSATGIEQRLRARTTEFRYETEHETAGRSRGVFARAGDAGRIAFGRLSAVIDAPLNVDRFESVRPADRTA
jgi:hypothetical protein